MFGAIPFSSAAFSSLGSTIHLGEFTGTLSFTQSSEGSTIMIGASDFTFNLVQGTVGSFIPGLDSIDIVGSFNKLANGMLLADGKAS